MSDKPQGFHNRREPICSKIRSLLISLTKEPSKYDEITPKIEYWIEYVLRHRFATVDELVEGVSDVAWDNGGSFSVVGRFLKEFNDAPHRSEQAKSFVIQLPPYVLQWFAIASAEDLWLPSSDGLIPRNGGPGFVCAASFIGSLIEWDLLNHELVRQHLPKPLTNHHNNYDNSCSAEAVRANAIYQLFTAAGNSLLQGLIDAEDVQLCFNILNLRHRWIVGFESAKIQGLHEIHAAWLLRRVEEEKTKEAEEHPGEGEKDTVAAEASVEVKTPVAFVPQNLPTATMCIENPSSVLQDIECFPVFHDLDSSLESFINVPSGTVSPTLSISPVSDLTPSELGEKQTVGRHDTFYLEDGNVEIACGDTIFRVHSSVISLSPSGLREILSQPALLDAPAPEGRPRITLSDSAEDFAILLKMIYTPGFPARHEVPEFNVFASLLRMTTKYDFPHVRDQIVKDLKGAYPTKWEDFTSAKVLGEDVFGPPKPHPNAVLNLFQAQKVKFAIPFAAYRASIGGFRTLMNDEPGMALPRHAFAGTAQGMHALSTSASKAARMVVYGGFLWVCPDKECTLNVGVDPVEKRMEALEKVYLAMIDKREDGLLGPPSLGHLLCTKCAKIADASHATWGSFFWQNLPQVFGIGRNWEEL